jgi:sporulation protein YlmC with PRC-barrel domain
MSDTRWHPAKRDVVTSEELQGAIVYDPQGTRLGKISALVIEKASGRVLSVILIVNGFLGLGHSHQEVPWSSLRYERRLNGLVADQPAEPPAAPHGRLQREPSRG